MEAPGVVYLQHDMWRVEKASMRVVMYQRSCLLSINQMLWHFKLLYGCCQLWLCIFERLVLLMLWMQQYRPFPFQVHLTFHADGINPVHLIEPLFQDETNLNLLACFPKGW